MRSLRCGTALVAVILAAAAQTGVGKAEDKKEPKVEAPGKVETKAVDLAVKKTLRDVINRGADLYNAPNSDYLGCYHLYEGALIAVRPLLDSRPELQKDIIEGLAAADREPQITQKAYVLRKVLDKVREEVEYEPGTKPTVAKTLWDRLGGEKGVTKVVDDLFDIAGSDPKVNFFRTEDGKPTAKQLAGVPALKKSVVAFFSSATGGPIKYEGKSMKDAHKGMGITSEQFDAFAADLKTALVKNGVKAEDVAIVLGAVGGTKKDIVEAAPPPPKLTLWDKLGGEKGVSKVVDDLFDIAGSDPKVNFFRTEDGKPTEKQLAGVPALKKSVIAFFSSATGGPIKYEGKSMKDAHKGMGITSEQFDAFAADLKMALEKNGVKAEDVAIVLTAVGGTKKDIVEPKAEPKEPTSTLWDRLGGEKGVTKVVDDLVATAGPDPKVNFFRKPDANPTAEQVAALKKSVIAFFSAATGGPIKYEGKSMKDAHKGMMITDAEFDAFAGHLKAALEKNGVKPEDVKTVMAAVGKTRADIVEKKETDK